MVRRVSGLKSDADPESISIGGGADQQELEGVPFGGTFVMQETRLVAVVPKEEVDGGIASRVDVGTAIAI